MLKSHILVGENYLVKCHGDSRKMRVTSIKPGQYRGIDLDTNQHMVVYRSRDFIRPLGVVANPLAGAEDQFMSTIAGVDPLEVSLVVDAQRKTLGLPPRKTLFVQEAEAIRDHVGGASGPHLFIEARAGTGKTTTLIEGLKELKQDWTHRTCKGHGCRNCRGGRTPRISPSTQQQAIWDSLNLSRDARTICFVAFGKDIAKELKERVPFGVEAMTVHSMGYRAVRKHFPRAMFTRGRMRWILERVMGKLYNVLLHENPAVVFAVEELVDLAKLNLLPMGSDDAEDAMEQMYQHQILRDLADHYAVDLEHDGRDISGEVFGIVPKCIDLCKDPEQDNMFDYNDMIWLPAILGLDVFRFDLLLVDESQDLNRCQHALVKRAGHRLVFCGDVNQSIYAFAGSDEQSKKSLEVDLSRHARGVSTLYLTKTYRCGHAIVEECKEDVPDFEAFNTNCPGLVGRLPYGGTVGEWTNHSYHSHVRPGDMILCRVSAPLVRQCFIFLSRGMRASVLGRDMVGGLTRLARDLWPSGGLLSQFLANVAEWMDTQTSNELKKPNPSVSKIRGVTDRANCLITFATSNVNGPIRDVAQLCNSIDSIFTSDGRDIRLSTIHKAKGLEARAVFLLMPERAELPSPKAKTPGQLRQEYNLRYVARSRAIEELWYVT